MQSFYVDSMGDCPVAGRHHERRNILYTDRTRPGYTMGTDTTILVDQCKSPEYRVVPYIHMAREACAIREYGA